MNKILILICLIFLPLALNAQEKKAISNKLKTVTVNEQKWEKGIAGKVEPESVTRYDQSGNIIEEIEYKQGRVDKHVTYKYDAASNKIQETELDASGKKTKVTVYVYKNNLRTERTVYDGNNRVLSKKTYLYETY